MSGGERERGSGEGDRERQALVREIQRETERERLVVGQREGGERGRGGKRDC